MTSLQHVKSIRPFIGARDYQKSRAFYRDLGFQEHVISGNMSLFSLNETAFYLQDYYVEEWINNTMILVEVDSADKYWNFLLNLHLDKKYAGIKLVPVQKNDWGDECMLIDPSGVLWHFAEFH
jgi:catechol 2,3-dioxygenase-like lactoylglutathione lyase family enzyme